MMAFQRYIGYYEDPLERAENAVASLEYIKKIGPDMDQVVADCWIKVLFLPFYDKVLNNYQDFASEVGNFRLLRPDYTEEDRDRASKGLVVLGKSILSLDNLTASDEQRLLSQVVDYSNWCLALGSKKHCADIYVAISRKMERNGKVAEAQPYYEKAKQLAPGRYGFLVPDPDD